MSFISKVWPDKFIKKKVEQDAIERYFGLMDRLYEYRWGAFYKVPGESPLIKEARELAEDYEIFTFNMYFEAKFSKKEMEEAVAYIPYFGRMCYEYDDSPNFFKIACNKCCHDIQIDNLEIKNQGAIKKYKDDFATFRHVGQDFSVVTIPMYQYLCESGVDKRYFRPVYARRDKENPIGYQIYSEDALPEGAVISGKYEYYECRKCKAKIAEYQMTEQYEHFYITKDAVDNMKPISVTYELYSRRPEIVVSKEVYDAIIEKDPKAYFFPVYLKE